MSTPTYDSTSGLPPSQYANKQLRHLDWTGFGSCDPAFKAIIEYFSAPPRHLQTATGRRLMSIFQPCIDAVVTIHRHQQPQRSFQESRKKEMSANLATRRLSNALQLTQNVPGSVACRGDREEDIVNRASVRWRICECHQLTAPTYLYS